jgi:hypothetical protein
MGDRPIPNHGVDLVETPHITPANASGTIDVVETSIGDSQPLHPPGSTVEQFVSYFAFDPGAVGIRILSAIASRRMLFDEARFTANTDRAPDVPEASPFPNAEHCDASIKA